MEIQGDLPLCFSGRRSHRHQEPSLGKPPPSPNLRTLTPEPWPRPSGQNGGRTRTEGRAGCAIPQVPGSVVVVRRAPSFGLCSLGFPAQFHVGCILLSLHNPPFLRHARLLPAAFPVPLALGRLFLLPPPQNLFDDSQRILGGNTSRCVLSALFFFFFNSKPRFLFMSF